MGLGIAVAIGVMLIMPSIEGICDRIYPDPDLQYFRYRLFRLLQIVPRCPCWGRSGRMYGRIRLGGTIGWGLFAPIAGALDRKPWLEDRLSNVFRDHVYQFFCQPEVFLWQEGGTGSR